MKKEMKKQNNKGFSLVELIVVIAIMAVLVGVLAPAYLRYLEKSRVGTDNDSIGKVAEAIKTAAADEDIFNALGTGTTVKISKDGEISCDVDSLKNEIQTTINQLSFKSKKYKTNGITLNVAISDSNQGVTVSTDGWYKDNTVTNPTSYTF